MKNLLVFVALIATTSQSFGQAKIKVEYEGVTINNTSQSQADPSAVLDVNSNNKGVVFPRLTSEERDQIASPTRGLLIYNLTSDNYEFFNGADWMGMALVPGDPGTNGGGGSTPLSLSPDLWLESNVLPRTNWNTTEKHLNNSGVGIGMDGQLGSGVALECLKVNEDNVQVNLNSSLSYPFTLRDHLVVTTTSDGEYINFLSKAAVNDEYFGLRTNGADLQIIRKNGTSLQNIVIGTVASGEAYDVCVVFISDSEIAVTLNGVFTAYSNQASIPLPSFDTYLVGKLRLIAPHFGDTRQINSQLWDEGLTESQTVELFNNPQKFLPTGAGTPIIDLRYNEADGNDDPIIFNYGSGNHGQFSTTAASPYNPWVTGLTTGYQTALGQFNRYVDWSSVSSEEDSGLETPDVSTILIEFIEQPDSRIEFRSIVSNKNGFNIDYRGSTPVYITERFDNLSVQDALPFPDLGSLNIDTGNKIRIEVVADAGNGGNFTVSYTNLTKGLSTSETMIITGGDFVVTNNTLKIRSNITGLITKVSVNNSDYGIFSKDAPVKQNIFGTTYNSTTDIFGNAFVNEWKEGMLNFVGGNHSGINAGNSFDNTGDLSSVFGIYLPSGSTHNVFAVSDRLGNTGFVFRITSGMHLAYTAASGSTYNANNAIEYDKWIFYSFTRTAAGILNFYKRDENSAFTLVGTPDQTTGTPVNSTSDLIIGQYGEERLIPPVIAKKILSISEMDQLVDYWTDNIINP